MFQEDVNKIIKDANKYFAHIDHVIGIGADEEASFLERDNLKSSKTSNQNIGDSIHGEKSNYSKFKAASSHNKEEARSSTSSLLDLDSERKAKRKKVKIVNRNNKNSRPESRSPN